LVPQLREALTTALGGDDHQNQVRRESENLQRTVSATIEALRNKRAR
jgi:hypothetical protein